MRGALERVMRGKNAIYFIVGCVCAIVFCTIYGVCVLNPTYTDWLLAGGDLTQHYLGWKAYRASDWHFPIGMVDTLAYPYTTSVIFTDSIPLVALFFKILSPILPKEFQFFGLWGILCFILQGILATRIIKKHTDNKIAIVLASMLFTYVPVMIFRMYVHTSLAGQWILLYGLEPLLDYSKYKSKKKIYMVVAILGVLSAGIHIYYVLMSGIVLAGICILDILECKRVKRSVLLLGTYLSAVCLVTGIFGGFSSGMQASKEGLGKYSFNLNGLLNPQGWSCIFGDLPLYGNGQYEGLGYLGAGCFLLLILAGTLFLSDKRKKVRRYWKRWVAIGFVAITSVVVAISPIITLNDSVLLTINIPDFVAEIWAIFRSTGRVVWVLIDVMMLGGLIILCQKLKGRLLVLVFAIVLVVQIYDIHGVLLSKYRYFSGQKKYESELTDQSFWGEIAADDKINHVVYCSAMDRKVMYDITDWALDNNKTLNDFYFARPITDKVSSNVQQALLKPSVTDLFIFSEQDKMKCLNYNLHFYQVDGLVVGCVNEIDGCDEMESEEYYNTWNFGGDRYLSDEGSRDTAEGRELCPNGFSYGPYWFVSPGKYEITIFGDDLPEDIQLGIRSEQAHIYHEYKILNKTKNAIKLQTYFEKDISDLEVYVVNASDENVVLKSVKLQYKQ